MLGRRRVGLVRPLSCMGRHCLLTYEQVNYSFIASRRTVSISSPLIVLHCLLSSFNCRFTSVTSLSFNLRFIVRRLSDRAIRFDLSFDYSLMTFIVLYRSFIVGPLSSIYCLLSFNILHCPLSFIYCRFTMRLPDRRTGSIFSFFNILHFPLSFIYCRFIVRLPDRRTVSPLHPLIIPY